ncbi:MAG: hypothetical protein ISQ75_03345 [Puniceicoccaceae bacterium]|nr:hypothetical protein [Puniceicoccaceae bacterium]
MSRSISIDVHLKLGDCGHQLIRKGTKPRNAKPTRLPRITRLMALAIKYEQLIERGTIKNQTELANLAGVDRSHVSRILRLRLLAPKIQEALLNLPEAIEGADPILWKHVDPLTQIAFWEIQQIEFRKILPTNRQQSG